MKKRVLILMGILLYISVNMYAQRPKPQIPDLTEEQQIKIAELRKKFKDEAKPIRQEIKKLRDDYIKLATSDSPDNGDVEKAVKAIGDKRIEIEIKEAILHQEVRKLLTADQKDFYDKNMIRKGLVKKKKKPNPNNKNFRKK